VLGGWGGNLWKAQIRTFLVGRVNRKEEKKKGPEGKEIKIKKGMGKSRK